MSKYIKTIPLSSVERISIVQGGGRNLAQVRQAAGCDYAMNAGFYGGNGKPTHHLKADGKVLARAPWGCWGFAWNGGADIRMEALPADTRLNYIAGVELLSPMVSDTGSIPYDQKGGTGRHPRQDSHCTHGGQAPPVLLRGWHKGRGHAGGGAGGAAAAGG